MIKLHGILKAVAGYKLCVLNGTKPHMLKCSRVMMLKAEPLIGHQVIVEVDTNLKAASIETMEI